MLTVTSRVARPISQTASLRRTAARSPVPDRAPLPEDTRDGRATNEIERALAQLDLALTRTTRWQGNAA